MSTDVLMPPADMIFIGGGDFLAIGNEFFRYFVDLAGLQPHHRVLDVGCGIGRMAIPLTRYLNAHGSYEGFDIVGLGIDWCRENFTSRFPNFHFQKADVYNLSYNPEGRYLASQYRFPYRSKSFDFVFLTSVFTHMLPPDVTNYVEEIARVLKVGGTFFCSYYLLNEESLASAPTAKSMLKFPHQMGPCRYEVAEVPEDIVGYEEAFIRDLYQKCGLEVVSPVHYGAWSGRPNPVSGQDILIARKARHVSRLGIHALKRLAALFAKGPATPFSASQGRTALSAVQRHVDGRNQELARNSPKAS
jgi:ubiquinone/menaquinone biosynthesis C-methylase UbiE